MDGGVRGGVGAREAWGRLHTLPRFRPIYPSETVVRFGMRHFGHAPPEKVILDVGCGGGRHTAFFASLGHRVIGLDHSWEGCRHTRSLVEERGGHVLVACAATQALCLTDASIDGAIAYGVLYYAEASGYRAAVNELWRVLRPGGHLLVHTRATTDGRLGKGARIDDRTFVMTDDSTNERGMTIHFLDRDMIAEVFASFTEIVVDKVEESFDGGTRSNSDWVIQLVK